MEFNESKKLINQIIQKDDMSVYQNQFDVYQLLCAMLEDVSVDDRNSINYAMKVSKYTHEMAAYEAQQTGIGKYDDLYWKLLLIEARNRQLDSYFLYTEKNREPDKRFYEPRRKKFLEFGITQAMPALIDDEIDLLIHAARNRQDHCGNFLFKRLHGMVA